ncbi:unnamed protein product [Lathyrus oleraceus]|uniref:Hydroxyproline-rich glycoprotein family protein n=1 Tax=Pisum sativum TaxID=3888 RepID=A0A9D4Y0S2_PEA|nr:protein PELPK1-like [Pisum sativum]KAI5428785.1 hypothetical protein KIW84_033694 [Pisum sativum]
MASSKSFILSLLFVATMSSFNVEARSLLQTTVQPQPINPDLPKPSHPDLQKPSHPDLPKPSVEDLPKPSVEDLPKPSYPNLPKPSVEDLPIIPSLPKESLPPLHTSIPTFSVSPVSSPAPAPAPTP